MKKLIIFLIISILFTVFAWTSRIYLPGLDLFLLPVMGLLLLVAIIGIVTIPLGIYYFYKKETSGKWLPIVNGIAIGFYLGYLVLIPIDNWDERERNLSGQIIVEKLEAYKISTGKYPEKLIDLGEKDLNAALPCFYKLGKFNYSASVDDFDLDIPEPIMARWHWDNDRKIFEYSD
jgi:hypothetical protein